MSKQDLNKGMMNYIQASPTPFHAVSSMVSQLEAAGFTHLGEGEHWKLEQGRGYFVTRSESSIIAFKTGSNDLANNGFHMAGAHTDSPCLKIKPQPEINKHQYSQLGVEVYGGALLNPWFDRDLSIAGRVGFRNKKSELSFALVNFEKPIAVIPSLAIHLDKDANKQRSINPQTFLPVIISQDNGQEKFSFRELLLQHLTETLKIEDAEQILSWDMCLYDVQAPAYVGLHQEFIASARLDNLLSCYVGLQSLLASEEEYGNLLICSDHEEVGSVSASGAKSPFLEAVLDRVTEALSSTGAEAKRRMLDNSFFISVDNAHGIHPNFSDKHDDKHGPLLNKGPVIKINSNQRYATSTETSAYFSQLCASHKIPLQSFVVRSDMSCGSTIGPIVAGELGVKTLDIGVPTFAMHSIREMAGSRDPEYLATALTAFYNR